LIQPKVRDGQKWRFKRVTIDNAWAQGDPEISCRADLSRRSFSEDGSVRRRRINALATHRALTTKSKPK
jgi:hypothetical protein